MFVHEPHERALHPTLNIIPETREAESSTTSSALLLQADAGRVPPDGGLSEMTVLEHEWAGAARAVLFLDKIGPTAPYASRTPPGLVRPQRLGGRIPDGS